MNAPKNARPNKIANFLVDILSNSDESDSKLIAHGSLSKRTSKKLMGLIGRSLLLSQSPLLAHAIPQNMPAANEPPILPLCDQL
jgi:hypothetical protein